ncbi:GTP-binding protein of the rab [Tulasnella sp. 427]|nr:GTP-binding protein of the rab [Tulasnella sp. 427]
MPSFPSIPIPEIKILLLGDNAVDETALPRRFLDERFAESMTTIGLDIKFKTMEIKSRSVRLAIWDTAGQEAYSAVVSPYYRGTEGVLLVYDVTRPESLNNLKEWVNQLKMYTYSSPIMIAAGNKVDLLSDLSPEVGRSGCSIQGPEFAKSVGTLKHAATSAKTGTGVKGVFEQLVCERYNPRKEALYGDQALERNVSVSAMNPEEPVRAVAGAEGLFEVA